jgi:hypothetical protein
MQPDSVINQSSEGRSNERAEICTGMEFKAQRQFGFRGSDSADWQITEIAWKRSSQSASNGTACCPTEGQIARG